MFSSSLRLGRAAFSNTIRNPATTLYPRVTIARAPKSTLSDTTPPASRFSTLYNSPAAKVAVGLSGVLFLCGLDCVAPTSYPYQDQAASAKAKTYWNDPNANPTSPREPSKTNSRLATTGAQQYQVVVVGGGMAGLHTALALSERQKGNILVVDANRIGESASGRSKGLAVPGLQVEEGDLARICGSKQLAAQIYEWTYQAANRLQKDIVQKYDIDCNWEHSGHVEASLHDDDNHEEEDDEDECHALTASQVRHVLGQPESARLYKGGELDPSCCGLDPYALTLGLARVLEEKWNVRIQEQTKVAKIEKLLPKDTTDQALKQQSMRYTLTTENGAKIECQHVVLCTGPELVSKQLSQRLKHAIVPIYTWMASTVPLGQSCPLQSGTVDEALDSTMNQTPAKQPSPAPMCGDDHVCLNYWRRTKDGRLLFGSLADAYPVPKWVAEYRLRRALRQVYPQLGDVPFEHIWGGRIAFSRDAVPLIGRDEAFDHADNANDPTKGGVWYATGFGGHGIIPTVMAGSILADAITGQDDHKFRLFQRTFPPKYTFWPVSQLGAQAVLTIYNVFDWLHVKGVPVPQLPKPW